MQMNQEKKVLIYGKGRVGNALKKFCEYNNIQSKIHDDLDNLTDFSAYDVIIPSPGIAPSHRIYQTGKIMGELDFVYKYLPENFKIISITGTDGKSTTAWIVYNLLKYGEKKVFLSGNFEIPFAETVQVIQEQWLKSGYIVLEVSSFMSYNIYSFKSNHSIFTNFETDHLNWHTDLEDYFNAKIRLFENTTGSSFTNEQVFSKAQELGLTISNRISHIRIFGKNENLKDRTDGENIIISGRKKYLLSETHFSWFHNAMNILSSTLVMSALDICSKRIREYLKNISGLSHRLEIVTIKNGITFVDDSKSTSAQSLIAALGSFKDKKICLIAGGSDKWDTFEYLWPILADKVRHVELIGATREILGKICEQYGISYHYSESMDEAVHLLIKISKPWDSILLSPGCASFGMFKDYLDRANKFREAIFQ